MSAQNVAAGGSRLLDPIEILARARTAEKNAADANHRIDAALALHQPIDALDMGRKNAHKVQVCTGCGQDDGNWNRWPCATVRALRGSEGRES